VIQAVEDIGIQWLTDLYKVMVKEGLDTKCGIMKYSVIYTLLRV